MSKKIKDLTKQFVKFSLVGALNTVIYLLLTYTLLYAFKEIKISKAMLTFLTSASVFCLTTLNSYVLNNKFVFKKTKQGNLWPLTKTFISYFLTFILSFVLTKLFTDFAKLHVFLVPVLSLALTVPLNFLLNKFWSFS